MTQIQGQIAVTKQKVSSDQANLRHQALAAYMDGTGTGLEELFAGPGMRSTLAKEYGSVAAGNVSSTIDNLHLAQNSLSAQQTQLQGASHKRRPPPPSSRPTGRPPRRPSSSSSRP